MRDHVRILAYLHIGFGALGMVAAVIVLFVFGGIAGVVGASNPGDPQAWHVAMPIIGLIGLVICAIVLLLSLPGVIAGFGLLRFRPWARILTIILSALHLPGVPFGTALGVYGFWVLLKPETERMFV
jgi:hypothetical protein